MLLSQIEFCRGSVKRSPSSRSLYHVWISRPQFIPCMLDIGRATQYRAWHAGREVACPPQPRGHDGSVAQLCPARLTPSFRQISYVRAWTRCCRVYPRTQGAVPGGSRALDQPSGSRNHCQTLLAKGLLVAVAPICCNNAPGSQRTSMHPSEECSHKQARKGIEAKHRKQRRAAQPATSASRKRQIPSCRGYVQGDLQLQVALAALAGLLCRCGFPQLHAGVGGKGSQIPGHGDLVEAGKGACEADNCAAQGGTFLAGCVPAPISAVGARKSRSLCSYGTRGPPDLLWRWSIAPMQAWEISSRQHQACMWAWGGLSNIEWHIVDPQILGLQATFWVPGTGLQRDGSRVAS
ncbi:uncharacterized protein B0I36DRAFT_311989 [Microdochium trichocladiopsis]|uniref:Uncharacterized protein n=1 Tax=Microdochium trichocladiopsis TaxID=1682393 RepID=A0A9P8YJ91_9PEZI|nr:uncharacterized protein B0I36DRAFT_311989 [Microdochium trichocladiopsis]KAH7041033.1 hypothetical protein B0I36DRAFT_311989 [Microdochium trichocladiopsis]